MGDIDDRLRELLGLRRNLPGSIAVKETLDEASTHVYDREGNRRTCVSWRT